MEALRPIRISSKITNASAHPKKRKERKTDPAGCHQADRFARWYTGRFAYLYTFRIVFTLSAPHFCPWTLGRECVESVRTSVLYVGVVLSNDFGTRFATVHSLFAPYIKRQGPYNGGWPTEEEEKKTRCYAVVGIDSTCFQYDGRHFSCN